MCLYIVLTSICCQCQLKKSILYICYLHEVGEDTDIDCDTDTDTDTDSDSDTDTDTEVEVTLCW